MAPIRETHPHPIWGLGDYVGEFLEKFGFDSKIGWFFDLMPQGDLDDIKDVGERVWGTGSDFENIGAVTGALHHAATQLPVIRDEAGASWRGGAFDKFKEKLDLERDFVTTARGISQSVGQALIDFAKDADASLADFLGFEIGAVGAVVGAVVGVLGGPPGIAVGAAAGALIGLAIGIAFAFFGVLLPKMLNAYQLLDELADQLPPDYTT